MKTIILTFLLFGTTLFSQSQTQREMNNNAVEVYISTDKKLGEVYQTISSAYKENIIFIKNLKTAQLKWVQYRDAQLAMKYPPQRESGYYGSVLPMCKAIYLTKLTEQRIKELEEWLIQEKEGDVCVGTVGEFKE